MRLPAILLLAAAASWSKDAAPAAPAPPFSALEKRLDEALAALGPAAIPAPDVYVAAKGKLRETQTLVTTVPGSDYRPRWEKTCSLHVEAAIHQLQALGAEIQQAAVQAERVAVLTELSNSLDEINRMERGYASSLRADLEEQKRKAKDLRDEAEKRFNELNSALIQVKKDARGTIISMSDILFAVGKADLTEDLKTNLAKIAGILTIYKDAKVIVEGHTDNQGTAEYNQKLSEKRAQNVLDFLVNPGGIQSQRLSSAGYGFTKPVAENDTKEGRQKNRRVDLVISDKKPN